MDINSPRARQLMALSARLLREHASDVEVDYDGTTCDGTALADDLEAEVEDSLDGENPIRRFVIQQEYDGRRAGEPSNWQWQDSGVRIPHGLDEAGALEYARDFVRTRHENRFIRGWRLVERFEVAAIVVRETISEKPGLPVDPMAEQG